jgi:hypothetical protein
MIVATRLGSPKSWQLVPGDAKKTSRPIRDDVIGVEGTSYDLSGRQTIFPAHTVPYGTGLL